jgi:SAM-dependent MidA family methyltransferase
MTHEDGGSRPGYRYEPRPNPGAVGEDPELVARIRAEITEGGSITFARFMERALYEPGHGYYRRADRGPGLAGNDFLTAPEADPLFGAAIGRLLEQSWEALGRPDPFVVTEPGAGTGALALGLLGGLRDAGSPLLGAIRYRPVELEAARTAALASRLQDAGFGDSLVLAPPSGPAAETGAVVANEVMDALPVHRVVMRDGRLRERLVTVQDGGFVEVEGEPSTPALAGWMELLAADGIVLPEGRVAEVCLALGPWLAAATAHIARGIVVLVDYGDEAAELYADRPGREDGTLRTFARHAVGADPYRHVGRQDLTAHVDLTAVRRAADAAGLTHLGTTTQAELLVAVGAGELVAARLQAPGASLQDALALRSALARLMDPRGMGGFTVLAFGRGIDPQADLPGLHRRPRPRPGR